MARLGSGRLIRNAPSENGLEPLREFGVETWAQTLLEFVLSDERVSYATPATPDARERTCWREPSWFGEDEQRYVAELVRR